VYLLVEETMTMRCVNYKIYKIVENKKEIHIELNCIYILIFLKKKTLTEQCDLQPTGH